MTIRLPLATPFLLRLSVPALAAEEILGAATEPGKRRIGEYATRSYMTDAQVDPTGDEQTDR